MKEERDPELKLILEEALETPGEPHPDPEQLVSYHHDLLEEAEAEKIQDHLARCRACSDLYLELARFGSDDEEEDVEGLDVEADWRALEQRISVASEVDREDSLPFSGTEESRRRREPSRPFSFAMAAGWLLALGLGGYVGWLRVEVAELRAPQANVSIVHLYPEDMARGFRDEGVVRGDAERFVVILTPPSFPSEAEHRVDVSSSDGRRVWSGTGLRRTEAGSFHLELPKNLFPPGRYRFQLFAGEEPVADLELRSVE